MKIESWTTMNDLTIRAYVAAELHRELVVCSEPVHMGGVPVKDSKQYAELAVKMADDLIAELNK